MGLFDMEATEITSLRKLREAEAQCTRCPLYRNATQVVPGVSRVDLHFLRPTRGSGVIVRGHRSVGPSQLVLRRSEERSRILGAACADGVIDGGA